MEEIEVGEYVRTEGGLIAKYLGFKKDKYLFDNEIYWYYEYYIEYVYEEDWKQFKEDIVKHSKNLIDLIEVGDFVNGSKVLAVMEDMATGELHLEMTIDYTNKEIGDCTIYNKDIKEILTKESYMANCYKVGGEDE